VPRAMACIQTILSSTLAARWRRQGPRRADRPQSRNAIWLAVPLTLLSLGVSMGGGAAWAQPVWMHVAPDPARPAQDEQLPFSLGDWRWFHKLIGEEPHHITWWQMSIRGVLIFFFALALMRIARRAFERAAPIDIILSVLIGSNLSRAFTANAAFAPTLAATAVLIAVYWIVILAAMHSRLVSLLVKGRRRRLVYDGEIDRAAMAHHGMTEEDLREAMRSSGIRDLDEVEAAYLERNGTVSLLRRRT